MKWNLVIDEWEFPIAIIAGFNDLGRLPVTSLEIEKAPSPTKTEEIVEPFSISIYENRGDTNWTLSPEWIISHPPDRGDEENVRQREYPDDGILREQDGPREGEYYYDIGEYWFANQ